MHPDTTCSCELRDRAPEESEREWLKAGMCQAHWMQTDYFQEKLGLARNILQGELLDLITLMPDSQTQEIVDYISELRAIRAAHK